MATSGDTTQDTVSGLCARATDPAAAVFHLAEQEESALARPLVRRIEKQQQLFRRAHEQGNVIERSIRRLGREEVEQREQTERGLRLLLSKRGIECTGRKARWHFRKRTLPHLARKLAADAEFCTDATYRLPRLVAQQDGDHATDVVGLLPERCA